MTRIGKELRMEFKNEHQKLLLNLIFTSNWLRHLDTDRLRPYALSPQQYNVLRILRGAKGKDLCMYQVLERMLDRSPNATRLTEKLIAKGLVVRERSDSDRREVHLRITPKGTELVQRVEQESDDAFFAVAHKLSEAEAAALNLGLDKLRT